jgi:hypothetical protein
MSCDNVQERISSILDRDTAAAVRENVLAHIGSCRQCSDYLAQQQTVREAVRGLNPPPVPAALSSKLRVMASHERERQLTRVTFAARLRNFHSRFQLFIDNLMRPLAFPFAGGLEELGGAVTMREVLAMETYPDMIGVPARYISFGACAVIAIWTKR